MPHDIGVRGEGRGGGGALGSVVLVSLVVVTLLCTIALIVALCVVGSGLSGRMDETDRRVSVLLQRITDLEVENDYLFEERDADGEVHTNKKRFASAVLS